jgi:hypothetical protein
VREECVVDLVGVLDVVDGELILHRLLLEPHLGCFYKRPMDPSGLSQHKDAEFGRVALRHSGTCEDEREKCDKR